MEIQKKWINVLIVIEVSVLIFVCVFGLFVKMGRDFDDKEIVQTDQDDTELDKDKTEEEKISTVLEVKRVTFSVEVESKLAEMTIEEKVAQMFIVTPEELTGVRPVAVAGNTSRNAMANYPIGGVMYTSGNYLGDIQFRDLISGFQGLSQEITGMDLFVIGTEVPDDIYNYGISLKSIATLTPTLELVQTGMDPAAEIVFIANEISEELTGDPGLLCSFSPATVNCLRDEMGYQGVIISGNLSDTGVTSVYGAGEAAVTAVKAGMDVIYNPSDFSEAYNALLNAVENGEVDSILIENAVGRILTLKTR